MKAGEWFGESIAVAEVAPWGTERRFIFECKCGQHFEAAVGHAIRACRKRLAFVCPACTPLLEVR